MKGLIVAVAALVMGPAAMAGAQTTAPPLSAEATKSFADFENFGPHRAFGRHLALGQHPPDIGVGAGVDVDREGRNRCVGDRPHLVWLRV